MKLRGEVFKNSATCEGIAFTPDAPLDMAEITISGRYSESGWAKNRKSHEIVRVLGGTGSLQLRDADTVCLAEGHVVHVPAGRWFAWGGNMTILMACSPAFDPRQYEIEKGVAI